MRQLPAKYGYRVSVTAFTLVAMTWALSLFVSIYCAVCEAVDTRFTPVWDQNNLHSSALTMDSVVGSFFWLAPNPMLNLTPIWPSDEWNLKFLSYIYYYLGSFSILSVDPAYMDAIVDITSHVGLFNVLHSASLILFVSSHFTWTEVVLVSNFANMSVLYFRCSRLPWLIRSSLASGPLAWAFFAVFWNGGFLIPQVADKTRPAGSVFLWWILCYGMSFAFTYKVGDKYVFRVVFGASLTIGKDDAVCYSLSVLVAAVGLYHARNNAQFHQWVPPIAIAAVLYATFLEIFISRWESNELRKQAAMGGASGYGGEEGRQTRNDSYRLLRE
jgi:hypothetical protein